MEGCDADVEINRRMYINEHKREENFYEEKKIIMCIVGMYVRKWNNSACGKWFIQF